MYSEDYINSMESLEKFIQACFFTEECFGLEKKAFTSLCVSFLSHYKNLHTNSHRKASNQNQWNMNKQGVRKHSKPSHFGQSRKMILIKVVDLKGKSSMFRIDSKVTQLPSCCF